MSEHSDFPLSEFEDLLETLHISLEDAEAAVSNDPKLQWCIKAANGDLEKIRKCLQLRLPEAKKRLNEFLRNKRSDRESGSSL